MNFAQSILRKYGWSEGQGLGKNNSGISKPLKSNLKFDTSGLGHDGAAEFKDNWWECAYNSASANLDVKTDGESVKMGLRDPGSVKISKGINQTDDSKSSTYGNFVRCATLTAQGREDRIEEESGDAFAEYVPLQRPLNDEELFKACGGRTAHKGARHGLTLSGKLARLAEQDNILLQKMSESKKTPDDVGNWQTKVSKRKKKRCPIAAPTPHGSPEAASNDQQDFLYFRMNSHRDTTKKVLRRDANEESDRLEASKVHSDRILKMSEKSHGVHKHKDKKKKHRREEARDLLTDFQETLRQRIAEKSHSKKKSKRNWEDAPEDPNTLDDGGETSRSHKRLRVTDEPCLDRGIYETSTGIEVELDDTAAGHRTDSVRESKKKKSSRSQKKRMRNLMDKFAKSLTTKDPSDDEGIDP
uniref:G patch domain-containing protein 4 n=1 Tax=Nyssomyia neivai TaxID=330878 RepID=A0A1L8DAL3_9DIPT